MNPDNMDSVMATVGALTPAVSFIAGIIAAIACAHWFLQKLKEAFQEPFGQSEDKRKKKKDEYDAYYDERLDSSDPNIAYYEDASAGAIHHE